MIAEYFAKSGYFKDARTTEQCFTKIFAGQELGVGPTTAMTMLHILAGKITMDATLVGAKIKMSGRYDYEIRKSDEHGCEIEFFQNRKSQGTSTFTTEDAQRAGLTGGNWKTYPRDMMRSRAMTRGARMYCPDVFNGAVYTPEELDGNTEQNDAPPAPQQKETPPDPEKERFETAVRSVRAVFRLTRDSTDEEIRKAFDFLSAAFGLVKPARSWKAFTVAQLEQYAEAKRAEQEPIEEAEPPPGPPPQEPPPAEPSTEVKADE